jgi:hypothetical protein
VLSARTNYLLASDGYSGATITPATGLVVMATGLTDERGESTARQIRNTTTTEQHRLFTSVTAPAVPYTVWVKNVDAGFVQLSVAGVVVAASSINFNLSTGVVDSVNSTGAVPSGEISLEGGFYKCTFNPAATETGIRNAQLYVLETGGAASNPAITGTAKSVIVGSAMLGAGRYQRVNTATDYDTVGFPHYLKFDGVDDSLSTGSIDFTSTDKMTVFAGVRKLSDTATGAVVEFDITTNIGSFGLFAPYGAAANYSFRSQGTVQSVNTVAGFTSPITNVITCLGDIAGDSNIFRANGVATALGSDQGTGNFSNKILYIGRRGGTSLPFNGHLYSLIVRGAQSSDSQIASAESYVNSKTGAY